MALVAAVEQRRLQQRAQSVLTVKWLEQGRGWPGRCRFGTVRDPLTRHVVEDPQTAHVVPFLFSRFLVLNKDKGGSIRALAEEVARDFDIVLSRHVIGKVLRDEFYVTGERTAIFGAQSYPVRRLNWTTPVSPDTFRLVQSALVTRPRRT